MPFPSIWAAPATIGEPKVLKIESVYKELSNRFKSYMSCLLFTCSIVLKKHKNIFVSFLNVEILNIQKWYKNISMFLQSRWQKLWKSIASNRKKWLDYFIILYNQGHGCWCPGYIQSQGISSTWTTADLLSIVSTLLRHESIICACISVLSRLNHSIGYLIFDITRYTVTRHLKGNTICIHILLRQQLTSI